MSKSVLLINPIARAWAKPNCFPMGLGFIAHTLHEHKHMVKIVDHNVHRDMAKMDLLPTEKPDVIGITGIVTQYREVRDWIEECWIAYGIDAPIVVGGPLASSLPELVLRKCRVDYCVVGEGEATFVDFLLKGRPVEGMAWMDRWNFHYSVRQPIKPNILPLRPRYEDFELAKYIRNPVAWYNVRKWKDGEGDGRLSTTITGSRGCVGHCTYCYHNYMGQGYRYRQMEDILDEISFLYYVYGVKYFHFVDDALMTNRGWMVRFCSEIADRGFPRLGIQWSCAGRANVMDNTLAFVMADAGCVGVCYGIESGSQHMLNSMHKGIRVQDYERAIEIGKRHFQYFDYSFIVGTPGETDETVQESVDFCLRNEIHPNAVFYMTPYPGTPLFEEMLHVDQAFFKMAANLESLHYWVSDLSEQGWRIAWNCSGAPDEKLHEWHLILSSLMDS